MNKDKLNIGFFGCGFLTSYILPTILPFANTITLIDKDRIEGGNYDNAIFPKGLNNSRKVTALSNLIQILDSIPTIPIHRHINSVDELPIDLDIAIITFDNIQARQLGLDYVREKNIIGINTGVTENYGVTDWVEFTEFPTSAEKIAEIEKNMERIADVCERIEFRTLGALIGTYTAHILYDYINEGRKYGYILNIRDGVVTTEVLHI